MVENLKLEHLGQSGLLIRRNGLSILLDPYLSNSVEELDSPDLVRQVPIKYRPEKLKEINWVLITHDHIDHCDPKTIPQIASASPNACFVGPKPVREKLIDWGISSERILPASKKTIELAPSLRVQSIKAAHPHIELDSFGETLHVGWLFEHKGKKLYAAGDTSVSEEVITDLRKHKNINFALLPVNEDNFFRRRRGIIGNMSIREAFHFASELNIEVVIPVHWDLFSINSALPDEIMAVYKGYNWPFKLTFKIEEIVF